MRAVFAAAMSTVPAVHEDVQEQARHKQQERQRGEEMRPVLSKEEVQSNGTQDDQADGIA